MHWPDWDWWWEILLPCMCPWAFGGSDCKWGFCRGGSACVFVKFHGLIFPLRDLVMGTFVQPPAKGRVCQNSTRQLLLMHVLLTKTYKEMNFAGCWPQAWEVWACPLTPLMWAYQSTPRLIGSSAHCFTFLAGKALLHPLAITLFWISFLASGLWTRIAVNWEWKPTQINYNKSNYS